MSFIYIWKSENIPIEDATSRFETKLHQQTELFSSSFGRKFAYAHKKIGNVFIGQIDLIKGIKEWKSWVEHDNYGIAWSGVCETFLGVDINREKVKELHEISLLTPKKVVEWDGNFAFVSWDSLNEIITITTGATQSQPLWYASGPNGWACGSRSKQILDLTGKEKSFNIEEAGLFCISEYHMGGGTFFKHIYRLAPLNQIVIRNTEQPKINEYSSLFEYLTLDFEPIENREKMHSFCAERLRDRIKRQYNYSENPVLELSGGKDSRCIGAAIYRNGNTIRTVTGGAQNSPEVKIAKKVAQALHFAHDVEVHNTDGLILLDTNTSRAKKWVQLTEGLETVRQGFYNKKFFNNGLPIFTGDMQFFNGHHYGLLKSLNMNWTTSSRLLKRIEGKLKNFETTKALLYDILEKIDNDINSIFTNADDERYWSFMFYWQSRGSLWGSNVMSVKQPFAWWWLPLIGRPLIQYSWWLIRDRIEENLLVDQITLRNAPHLREVPDIGQVKQNRRKLQVIRRKIEYKITHSKLYKKFRKEGYYYDSQYFPVSVQREALWKKFFDTNNYAWRDIVDENYINDLITNKPNSLVLWNLATIELFSQEYF